uniref:Uncharacterized protein n=1 Tax=Anguilla anguilla TaxID=7936 RepID=A0A0E9V806_ANGAN
MKSRGSPHSYTWVLPHCTVKVQDPHFHFILQLHILWLHDQNAGICSSTKESARIL